MNFGVFVELDGVSGGGQKEGLVHGELHVQRDLTACTRMCSRSTPQLIHAECIRIPLIPISTRARSVLRIPSPLSLPFRSPRAVSHIRQGMVTDPGKEVSRNQSVKVKVISMTATKMSLSMKVNKTNSLSSLFVLCLYCLYSVSTAFSLHAEKRSAQHHFASSTRRI